MKSPKLFVLAVLVSISGSVSAQTLKDAYRDYWYTGVSVNQWQVKAENGATNQHD